MIEDLSSPSLVDALETNMVEFWKAYGQPAGRQLEERSDFVRVMTGIPFPLFNGVYRARLSRETVMAAIAETRAAAERWHVPLFWWLYPGVEPPDLATTLLDNGFSNAGASPAMAVELAQVDARTPLPHGLTIEQVDDDQTLATWAAVLTAGFDLPPSIAPMVQDLEREIGFRPDASLRRYLGRMDGDPVATCAMVLNAGVAGIYAVTTLPGARGRGYGAAITRIPLLDALAAGYKVGTLQASEMGYPIYVRLGFRRVCDVALYLLPPGS